MIPLCSAANSLGNRVARCGFSLSILLTALLPFLSTTVLAQAFTIDSIRITPSTVIAAGTPVTFEGIVKGNGGTLTFDWEFGDTEPPQRIRAGAKTTHTYAKPGNYGIFLRVTSNSGDFQALIGRVLVHEPTAKANEIAQVSSPVVVDSIKRTVWVVNPDSDTVTTIGADSMNVIREISTCQDPRSVALDKLSRTWIVCHDDDTVMAFDGERGGKVGELKLPWGSRPSAILAHPSRNSVYVSTLGTGLVYEIDTSSFRVTRTFTVGPTASSLAFDRTASKLYISRFISSDQGGMVWVVDISSGTLGSSITISPDTTSVDGTNSSRGIANYLLGLVVSRVNSNIWIGGKKDNIFGGKLRDTSSNPDLGAETTVRSFLSLASQSTGREDVSRRIDLNDLGMITFLSETGLGNHVLAALPTNNLILVLDAFSGNKIASLTVPSTPEGLALDPVTNRIFTMNLLDRSTTVIDASDILQKGSGDFLLLKTVKTVSREKMSSEVLEGKKVFYNASDARMALNNYMSCASCHLDGGFDGRTWDFTGRGEGLRNTTSLRGQRGDQNGKVHWTGNFDEIQDFEHDMRNSFGGTGFLSDAQFNNSSTNSPLGLPKKGLSRELDAMAAYVNSLTSFDRSPYRDQSGGYSDDAKKGGALFFSLECASCHSGALLSDSPSGKRHKTGTIVAASGKRLNGTLDGLDTPTLIGLAQTAPYFHDGSAPTIESALSTSSRGAPHDLRPILTTSHIRLIARFLSEIDSLDGDTNNNGVSNLKELSQNASLIDIDNDGLDDAWELQYFKNLSQTSTMDFDGDGVTNGAEFKAKTDPTKGGSLSPTPRPTSVGTPKPQCVTEKCKALKKLLLTVLMKILQRLQDKQTGSARKFSSLKRSIYSDLNNYSDSNALVDMRTIKRYRKILATVKRSQQRLRR
jgi:large repetitive protein